MKEVKPTKEQFQEYVQIQMSGITNMLAMSYIRNISVTGLDESTLRYIYAHYSELKQEYITQTKYTSDNLSDMQVIEETSEVNRYICYINNPDLFGLEVSGDDSAVLMVTLHKADNSITCIKSIVDADNCNDLDIEITDLTDDDIEAIRGLIADA